MNQKIKKTKKVRKIKIGRIFLLLFVIVLSVFLLVKLINKKITNIYIYNNKYIFTSNNDNPNFREHAIIDIAELSDYPSSILNSSSSIKERLIKNIYIKDAKVYKKNIFEVHIFVYENRPLFYNNNINKTVLETSDTVDEYFAVPTLVNYVPDEVYKKLIEKMNGIDDNILNHTSEIKYDPNSVDEERFLFTMTDGNYVYVTLSRFNLINNYLDIIKEIDDKKGVLYLDYGDHFVFE